MCSISANKNTHVKLAQKMLKDSSMNMKLTDLETKMLRNIALNDYAPGNGAEPETFADTGGVWSNCLDCGPDVVTPKSRPGVIASLVKKGLIWQEGKGSEAVIALTRKGYDAYAATRGARNAATKGSS